MAASITIDKYLFTVVFFATLLFNAFRLNKYALELSWPGTVFHWHAKWMTKNWKSMIIFKVSLCKPGLISRLNFLSNMSDCLSIMIIFCITHYDHSLAVSVSVAMTQPAFWLLFIQMWDVQFIFIAEWWYFLILNLCDCKDLGLYYLSL